MDKTSKLIISNLRKDVQYFEALVKNAEKYPFNIDEIHRMQMKMCRDVKQYEELALTQNKSISNELKVSIDNNNADWEKLANKLKDGPEITQELLKDNMLARINTIMPARSLAYNEKRSDSPLEKALETNFKKFHATKVVDDISFPKNVKSTSDMLDQSFEKYGKISLADRHGNAKDDETLHKAIEVLGARPGKNKTLYQEMPREFSKLITDYQKTGNKKHLAAVYELLENSYNTDVANSFMQTIELATKNNVRVVGIEDDTKYIDTSLNYFGLNTRVATSNYSFTQRIKEDQKKFPGEYITDTGGAHILDHGAGRGLIADAIGAPTIVASKSINPFAKDYIITGKGQFGMPDIVVNAGIKGPNQDIYGREEMEAAKKVAAELKSQGGQLQESLIEETNPNKNIKDNDRDFKGARCRK